MKNEYPILSVCVRSYNQCEFLKIAIDSILSQKTTFDFNIIVSDDCSTDGTRELLQDYSAQYPGKFCLVFGEKNIGGPNNFRRVIETAQSKYVAFMDGDDYWVDNYKLQKQYDFMTTHPEYVGCFHNAYVRVNDCEDLCLFNSEFLNSCITFETIVRKHWFMPTSSEFVVRESIFFPEWYDTVPNDDYVINLGIAMRGNFYYMPDVMSVYRKHEKNLSAMYVDYHMTYRVLNKILTGYKDIYPIEKRSAFEETISYYQACIAEVERSTHPIKKWFYRKTYTRAIKNWIGKLLNNKILHI